MSAPAGSRLRGARPRRRAGWLAAAIAALLAGGPLAEPFAAGPRGPSTGPPGPAAPLRQEVAPREADEPAEDPVVLVVDGEPIRRRAYEAWLLRERGPILAPLLARAWAIRRAAEAEGRWPAPEAVRRAVEHELRARVENAFAGRREAWLAELASAGRSEPGRVAERAIELEAELALAALAELRDATPVQIDAAFRATPWRLEPAAWLPVGKARPDDHVLTVAEEPVARGPAVRWLRRFRGEVEARRFGESRVLELAAERAGVRVDDAAVAERARADTEAFVASFYGGDRDLWRRKLTAEGKTEADHERQARGLARMQLLLEGLWRARAGEADGGGDEGPPRDGGPAARTPPPTAEDVARLRLDLLRELEVEVRPAMFD